MKKYQVWVHFDWEGWDFRAYKSLRAARKAAQTAVSETYPVLITKSV